MPDILYTDDGQGTPVLFIHGFCETHEMWDDYKKAFTQQFRVLTVDLPGFGKSPLPPDRFSLHDIARELLIWLDDLDVDLPILIGHSLGGYIVLEMVKAQPECFAGFCLFHSTAQQDSQEKRKSRNKTIDFVNKYGVEVFAASFAPALFYRKEGLEEVIGRMVDIAGNTRLETLVAYTEAMRDRNDRTDVLKSFEGPIAILAGDKDTSVPLDKIAEQASLPKYGMITVLEDTGHMGMFEQSVKTREALLTFIGHCIEH